MSPQPPGLYLAYQNGNWLPADQVHIALDDYGFLMGVAVVERLRTFNGKPFRVADHMARLRRSLEIVGWDAKPRAAKIDAAISVFPRRNADHFTPDDDWTIIAFVTPGVTFDGSQSNVCVHGYPLPFAEWARHYDEGVKMAIVDVRQTPNNCWPAELKCRSRMHYYLADRQAAERVPGARAILLDQRGFIAEASTANVAAYFANRGLVVPKAGNVLPGVSQMVLAELAAEVGIPLAEADMTPEQFAAADEAMLTSTSVCMLPIVAVDEFKIGDGKPGPAYQKLLAAWSDAVGVDVAKQAQRFAYKPAK